MKECKPQLSWMVMTGMLMGLVPPAWGATEVTDRGITMAIERSLAVDQDVRPDGIDVRSQDGIVTLSGKVRNLLDKDLAVRHAESIKGVRAVVDQLEVETAGRPDEELAKDVRTALKKDPIEQLQALDATVSNAVVTLTGTVHSWAEKKLAAATVKGVKGVKHVLNNVVIQPKTERPDEEIQTDIEERLKHDVWLTGRRFNVQVEKGKVTLTGTVGSALEKRRAATDAYVLGVESVDADGVVVKWWARNQMRRTNYSRPDDAAIKQAVREAFLYDPRIWSWDPEVDVQYGNVTLTGVVDSLSAKRAAAEDARNTVGVRSVQNFLKVRLNAPHDDAAIGRDIRDAFMRDPWLEAFNLNVSVRDGVAVLRGAVETFRQRWRAEELASRVQGVVDVRNRLDVSDTWTWQQDWRIKSNIESEMFWSPFVDSDQVSVDVDDGVATLTGTVDSWWEREAAVDNAFEGGAKSVRNFLSVDQG